MTPQDTAPTRMWQAMVPDLPPLTDDADHDGSANPADTAERLLLLLHYSIDWDSSWVSEPRYRKKYWDEILPSRVRRAAYRASSLEHWWSDVSVRLHALAPRQSERRIELACLLRQPFQPVIAELRENLPALVMRAHIIADAVGAQRKAARR